MLSLKNILLVMISVEDILSYYQLYHIINATICNEMTILCCIVFSCENRERNFDFNVLKYYVNFKS